MEDRINARWRDDDQRINREHETRIGNGETITGNAADKMRFHVGAMAAGIRGLIGRGPAVMVLRGAGRSRSRIPPATIHIPRPGN